MNEKLKAVSFFAQIQKSAWLRFTEVPTAFMY